MSERRLVHADIYADHAALLAERNELIEAYRKCADRVVALKEALEKCVDTMQYV